MSYSRADTFCLVTSDSYFAYLCRKLRERGATVCIVREPKTPDALRNASDQFFEWVRPEPQSEPTAEVEVSTKLKGKGGPSRKARRPETRAAQGRGQAPATLRRAGGLAARQRHL